MYIHCNILLFLVLQTLSKVLCAVVKFDNNQQQEILDYEEQKQSLVSRMRYHGRAFRGRQEGKEPNASARPEGGERRESLHAFPPCGSSTSHFEQ